MKNLPPIRNENIVVQESGDETLVYDLSTNKAYCLNQTSSIVFNACGNNQTFEDLKREYKFTDDLIYLTLDELKKNTLLAGDYASPFAGLNRREVIRRVGLVSMAALPVISGLIAPSAANAASSGGGRIQACTTAVPDCSFAGGFGCINGFCCGLAGRLCGSPPAFPCCPGTVCNGTNCVAT